MDTAIGSSPSFPKHEERILLIQHLILIDLYDMSPKEFSAAHLATKVMGRLIVSDMYLVGEPLNEIESY